MFRGEANWADIARVTHIWMMRGYSARHPSSKSNDSMRRPNVVATECGNKCNRRHVSTQWTTAGQLEFTSAAPHCTLSIALLYIPSEESARCIPQTKTHYNSLCFIVKSRIILPGYQIGKPRRPHITNLRPRAHPPTNISISRLTSATNPPPTTQHRV